MARRSSSLGRGMHLAQLNSLMQTPITLEQRLAFLTTQLAAIAPALESKQPHIRALAATALHELRVWERLNACTDAAVVAEAAKMAAEDKVRTEKQTVERTEAMDRWKREEAPKIWREWHTRALTHQGDDARYLAGLFAAIPCGACKKNFGRHLAEHPPRWNEAGFDYFAWTVEIHNLANEELNKPTLTLEEARAIYAPAS